MATGDRGGAKPHCLAVEKIRSPADTTNLTFSDRNIFYKCVKYLSCVPNNISSDFWPKIFITFAEDTSNSKF